MADKEKTYLPMGTAGLVRYYEMEEGIKIKPATVVAMTVVFVSFVLVLKFFG